MDVSTNPASSDRTDAGSTKGLEQADEAVDNVECFQNFTSPEVFIEGLAGMLDQKDVRIIIKSQKYMLSRFEKTNEMLTNCLNLSATRYQNSMSDFKKHTQMLLDMKKDIDNVFRRIRTIKAKLAQQYPQAYEVAARVQRKEKINDEDDEECDDEKQTASGPQSLVGAQSRTESEV